MADLSKPVQTRDGRKARVVCTDRKGIYPVIALIDVVEDVRAYRSDGSALVGMISDSDLVNIPVRTSMWRAIFDNNNISYACGSWSEARSYFQAGTVAVLELIYDDGKLVDVLIHKEKSDD